MDAAAVEALIKTHVEKERERHNEELAKLRKSNEAADQLARQARIEQEKAKFPKAGDKRVIQFLLDTKNDLLDFQNCIKEFQDSDLTGSLSEDFLKKCIFFNNKNIRRIGREIESYEIANNSKYGWLTEKLFRQNEVFDKQESTKAWYELPEPKAAEKEGKLKKAEKEAARISQEREKAQKVESKDLVSSQFSSPPSGLGQFTTTPGYIQVTGSTTTTTQRGRGSGGRGRGGRGSESRRGVAGKSSVINIKTRIDG